MTIKSDYKCNLCGSDDYSLLYDKGRGNKIVYNYVCNKCGFVFILPRPSREVLDKLYQGGQFSQVCRGSEKPDDKKFTECEMTAFRRFNLLQSKLNETLWEPDNRSLLEVGCGTADFLRLMRGAGWKVLGLEPDNNFAESARERYGINVKDVELENYTDDNQFDMVCSFHVIEHVENPTVFLNKINNLLKPRGHLFLECPGIDFDNDIDEFFWDVHINTFSEITLKAFLAKTGFSVISSGYNGGFLWALACKDEPGTFEMDDHGRIRQLIQNAIAPVDQNIPVETSLIKRGIRLLINDPAKVPRKIKEKIVNRLRPGAKLQDNEPEINEDDAHQVAIRPQSGKAKLKLVHIGLHENGNPGDTLLFPAVRWLFQKHVAPTEFTPRDLHAPVTRETIEEINSHDGLVIGGGGLFLADSNPNNVSGWQWPCSLELLKEIKVPIIVFAVGYNRFRGQAEFASVFNENIRTLVEKSAFIGLRNNGSIQSLKNYLPYELHSKLIFQPCPTTVLSRYYPYEHENHNIDKVIAVNIAFDRHHLRFGLNEDKILWGLGDALLHLREKGWKPVLFQHTDWDYEAKVWFNARGLFAEELDLNKATPKEVIEAYNGAALALGMRGHAQMIPFGLGRPIYSLISHEKLKYFLEDIGRTEWGIDVLNEEFSKTVIQKFGEFDEQKMADDIKLSQQFLWESTLANLNSIKSVFGV